VNSQIIDLDSPIAPRLPGCPIPLTSSQARIWNSSLEADGRRLSLRMCASAVRIVGSLSLELLEMSIESVIRRHEALRTRIVLRSGSPYQHIEPCPARVLSIVDLSDQLTRAGREVLRLAQEFIDTPIDLAVGPLFEAKIWRLSDNEHVLILLIDHMVTDGISNGIVTREVWECYRQGVLGQPVSIPQAPVQFPDYAVWQAGTYLAWMEKHAEYWRQHLRGAGPTVIPADRNLSNKSVIELSEHIPFGDELTVALRGAARRERALLSVFVLTAYAVVLSAWCRTEDLLMVFASHGRHRPALRNTVGFVANTLHLRIQVKREQSFGELLVQVKREVASAFEHRDFERVQDLLPECATQVGFNWQSTHSKEAALDYHIPLECAYPLSRSFEFDSSVEARKTPETNQLRLLPFRARSPGVKVGPIRFAPIIFDTPSSLHMIIGFDPNILTPITIEKFGRNLLSIAKEICLNPTHQIASLLGKIDVH
jgi:hypothetical protein